MKEKVYVDRLFAGYEDTSEIKDFKEEIAGNLKERVNEFVSKGLDEEQAFDKAAAELGDITATADEVGKKKRNETIGQMYMRTKVPVTKRTAAGLTAATGILLLGVGLALLTFFRDTVSSRIYYVSTVLLPIAFSLYTYFGLTQETTAHYPMKSKRALTYGVVCLAGFFGAGIAIASFFVAGIELYAALGVMAVFIIPTICALIFMLVTEPKRQKPWLKAMVEREIEDSINFHANMVDPVKAAKFGVASGGLWILAVAVFLTLGFIAGWQFAWLVFFFALAIQVFLVATIFAKKS